MRRNALTIFGALALAACTATGDPQSDRALAGAAGGALIGQILGGDTEASLLGAVAGAAIGGITSGQPAQQDHPCAEIYRRYSNPEVAGDYCEVHLASLEG
ncbi:glycine zipper 2TM domain-containing protein [Palleronia sp.]|uniref:glycine zipper 2TM domain-containing protein n=1 Tax=Palleronia sp. TaxID=1940284 RepID=UPI0035C7B5EC